MMVLAFPPYRRCNSSFELYLICCLQILLICSSPKLYHLVKSQKELTFPQTTNFRPFQTERVCRQQFWIWWKWWVVLWESRKLCGKRRNCSLRANFSFSHRVFKRPVCRHVKNPSLFGKRLILYSYLDCLIMLFDNIECCGSKCFMMCSWNQSKCLKL